MEVIQFPRDVTFTPEIDRLIDVMEKGGILFYVMKSGHLPPFLSFEFNGPRVSGEAIEAAHTLTYRFKSDPKLQGDIISYALAVGSAFHEFGQERGVWAEYIDDHGGDAA
ncbi:MAG: hypothetical protein KF735_02850 [Chelatococcus sp.]|uniref:hypothetical protein n=1 Tax=Chelatococcus sp. TaxID=1953771 RepID=UPI0025C06AAF|nr:hypothetical protein [Chelatococcus sp.]MBX3536553.1 hypothetical protein [Chelatococcus sp.]